jgi:hypothetical protein
MYIQAVAGSVMLCLQHGFYNIIFKIKHKLHIASGSAPPPLRKNTGSAAYTQWCTNVKTQHSFNFIQTQTAFHELVHPLQSETVTVLTGPCRGSGV